MKRGLRWLLACIVLAGSPAHAADGLRPFDTKSLEAIRAQSAGKPFVLAFWSVTCEPCREDMAVFKAAQKRFPGVPIHLVAADPPGEQGGVAAFLRRYDPGPVTRWAFVDDFSERVRYSVDPAWRGELPRTYLFDVRHVPKALTGTLERKAFERWLESVRRGGAE